MSPSTTFSPNLITTSHIRQAIEKIKGGEDIKPSTIYDVIVDGERYPPKEVMRLAHRIATGNDIWELGGGKPTNSVLENLGFDVRTKASDFSARRNYWKIAPDKQAIKWNEFFQKGIMAVGFSKNGSGDLRQYKSLKALEKAIGKENSNEAASLWACCHAPEGDVVFANKGRDTVVGIGIIEGPYEYLGNIEFPHIRKVKWLSDKEWTYTKGQFASEKRPRPNLFRIDTLSKTEVGPEILKAYLEKYPEYEQVFTENNIWPVFEEASYEKLVNRISSFNNHEVVTKYLDFLNQIVQLTDIKGNDESLFCSIPKSSAMLSISYNQRYASFLKQTKEGINCFVMLKRGDIPKLNKFDIVKSGKFGGKFENNKPELDWVEFKLKDGSELNYDLVKIVSEAILEEIKLGRKHYLKYIHKNSHSDYLFNAITDVDFRNRLMLDAFDNYSGNENTDHTTETIEDEIMNTKSPLNTILFGPPGTGKTYKLQNDYFKLYTESQASKTREQTIIELVAELSWWEVIAAVISEIGPSIVPAISQHEFIKAKISLSSGKTPKATIWNQLQHHTVKECENVGLANRSEPLIFSKDKNSVWSLEDKALEEIPQVSEFIATVNQPPKVGETIKNYIMTTFHQNFSYEDFIEGIKPRFSDDDESQLSYEIQKGLFYRACEKAAQLAGYSSLTECITDEKISRREKMKHAKPFAFFIDEINRANVSSVFGELITLIEDDKRLGAANEILDIKLPYSKSNFGVPLNLHIFGTMNTADRSVEALDTALRRRFSFVEMAPRYDLEELNIEIAGIKLSDILETINNRIEKLLDKDHQIGHSYLMNMYKLNELKHVFKNKILPLLQEPCSTNKCNLKI